ncbi:MAG: hypothetical protein EU544_05450 [Promethearchaeota archaeon]|nr:MAG: hypothetical protein EU544_05450 [Candidatus Lokiarchaeota archaeon]
MIPEYFYAWFILLAGSYFLILFGYMHFSDKQDTINNIVGFGSLFFVFIHILGFLLLMLQDAYLNPKTELWFWALGLPLLILGAIIVVSTFIIYLYRLIYGSKDLTLLEENWSDKMTVMDKVRRDTYRKISHVLIFIGLFVIWIIGYNYVVNATAKWAGMIPEENNTLKLYYQLLSKPDSIRTVLFSLGWFYYLIFFFFYSFCMFMLANELTRKTRYLSFPFNLLPRLLMTKEEKDSYGTYLYFAMGQMFAAFVCPPMVYFAILGMSGIGDLMTSQVGIRWGKHQIQWNQRKTWEGNVAGTITSFFICLPFIGVVWALIFAITFMAFDLFTNRPINLSDNLLIPIGCALIFLLIRHYLELDYFAFLYTFFS